MLRKLSSKSFQFLSASRSFSTNLPASNEPKQQREISREVKEAPKKISRKLDYLYGVNPVMTAIYSNQRKIHELFVSENLKEDNFRVQNIVSKANALKIPVKQMHKDKLEKFAQNQPHQGVILKCEPLQYIRIASPADLLKEKKTKGLVWIFIDQVTDPQNFGAILRAATFLGADGILVAEENRCPLTPTVSKTSAGALELIEINCIKDSVAFMRSCKDEGWRVVATALEKGNPNLKEVADLTLNADDNVIILLGSEHLGLKKGLINSSTDLVHIAPGIPDEEYKFPYTLLDSLNVSVSCGIVTKIIKEKLKKAQL